MTLSFALSQLGRQLLPLFFLTALGGCGAYEIVSFDAATAEGCIPLKYPQALLSLPLSPETNLVFKDVRIRCHIRQQKQYATDYTLKIQNTLQRQGPAYAQPFAFDWFIAVVETSSGRILLKRIYHEEEKFRGPSLPLGEKILTLKAKRNFSHMDFTVLTGFQKP